MTFEEVLKKILKLEMGVLTNETVHSLVMSSVNLAGEPQSIK